MSRSRHGIHHWLLIALFLVGLLLLPAGGQFAAADQEGTPAPTLEESSTPDGGGGEETPGPETTPTSTPEPEVTLTDTPEPDSTPVDTPVPEETPDDLPTLEVEATPPAESTPRPQATRTFFQEVLGLPATEEPGPVLPDTQLPSLTGEGWLRLGASLLIVALVAIFGGRLLSSLLGQMVKRTPISLDDVLLKATQPLIDWWIAAIGSRIAIRLLDIQSTGEGAFFGTLTFLLLLAVGLVTAWRLVDHLGGWYLDQTPSETRSFAAERLVSLVRRGAHLLIFLVGLTTLLGHFGIGIPAVVAALGIGGLALSLAARDTLADAIAGVTLLVDRPFRPGDRIEIPGLDTWGDVVDIGVRTTRVQTRDNRLVIVPNAAIAKSQVVNYTYPDPHYRVELHVGLAYGTHIERARQIIVDTVRQIDGVLPDRPVDAIYHQMGDSAMIFRVRWWIESYVDTNYIFDRVNTALQAALDDAGIDLPYPTRSVGLQLDPGAAGQPAGTQEDREEKRVR